jgi:ABC-type transport system substrate-binding protein
MTCENGEKITAESFKRSIERTILGGLKFGPPPVLNKLVGYGQFIEKRDSLAGITANGNILSFEFNTPMRDGVVQTLSLAPYGYICEENMKSDGSWRDKYKFISSGPYRVSELVVGKSYTMESRPEWQKLAHPNSPQKITVVDVVPTNESAAKHLIIDFFRDPKQLPAKLIQFKLVPEYLSGILFGNLHKGFFGAKNNRLFFRSLIEKNRDAIEPAKYLPFIRANSFFALGPQNLLHETGTNISERGLHQPTDALIIEGVEPPEESSRYMAWTVFEEKGSKVNKVFRCRKQAEEQNWKNSE